MTVSPSIRKSQDYLARVFEAIVGWVVSTRLYIVIAFLAAYLIADRLTLIHEMPLGITPWSPSAGVAVVLLLVGGFAYAPFVLGAEILSGILVYEAAYGGAPAAALTGGLCALAYIMRFALHFDVRGIRLSDTILLLTAVPSLVAIFTLAFCGAGYWAGVLPASSFSDAAWSFWVGTTSGIVTVLPVAIAVLASRQHPSGFTLATVLPDLLVYLAGTGAAFGLILALGKNGGAQYFYLSFPPIVWVAIRQGYAAVSVALLATHSVLSALMMAAGYQQDEFVANQVVMLVLSGTGLLLGAVVTERQIAVEDARRQSAELARISRIAAVGAMGSALAHEISQPLSTISAYVHAARRLLLDELNRGGPAAEALMQVESETARARRILERVRDCVSIGRVDVLPADMVEIVQTVASSCRGNGARYMPLIKVTSTSHLPKVMVDRVQIEQTLLNLITNAIDAVSETTDPDGLVHVHLSQCVSHLVLEISDNGRGIPAEMRERLFEPFETTKRHGMGLGLFLSRQIAEAHGGSLTWRQLEPRGTCFILEIPVDGPNWHHA